MSFYVETDTNAILFKIVAIFCSKMSDDVSFDHPKSILTNPVQPERISALLNQVLCQVHNRVFEKKTNSLTFHPFLSISDDPCSRMIKSDHE